MRENKNTFINYDMVTKKKWKEVDPLLGIEPDKKITDDTNIGRHALKRRRDLLGIPAWRKPAVDKDRFEQFAAEGLSYKELAVIFNRAVSTMFCFARDNNIEVQRPPRHTTPPGQGKSEALLKEMQEAKWRTELLSAWPAP